MSMFFLKGIQDLFLTILGVAYGCFVTDEDLEAHPVICLADGKAFLHKAIFNKMITSDEAPAVEAAMRNAGLLPDFAAVCEQVASCAPSPTEGITPRFKFQLCTGSDCPFQYPHGDIRNTANKRVSDPIHSLEVGFNCCWNAVKTNKATVMETAVLFRQMKEAGLPLNEKTTENLYVASLSKEEQRQYELDKRTIVEVPANTLVLKISIPAGFRRRTPHI